MAINFASLGTETQTAAPVAASIVPNSEGFLDLDKGTLLDLSKIEEDGEKLTVAKFMAEWDASEVGDSMDIDIGAITLGADGKISAKEGSVQQRAFASVLFHKHTTMQGIKHSGDNRDGSGDGPDETITVDLNNVDPSVNSIAFVAWIADATTKRQTFKMAKNSAISVANGKTGSVLGKFSLKSDVAMCTAVLFSEVVRDGNGGWLYHTIGEGLVGDLNTVLARFV